MALPNRANLCGHSTRRQPRCGPAPAPGRGPRSPADVGSRRRPGRGDHPQVRNPDLVWRPSSPAQHGGDRSAESRHAMRPGRAPAARRRAAPTGAGRTAEDGREQGPAGSGVLHGGQVPGTSGDMACAAVGRGVAQARAARHPADARGVRGAGHPEPDKDAGPGIEPVQGVRRGEGTGTRPRRGRPGRGHIQGSAALC